MREVHIIEFLLHTYKKNYIIFLLVVSINPNSFI